MADGQRVRLMRHFDKTKLLATFDAIFSQQLSAETRPAVSFAKIEKPPRAVYPILYLPVEVKSRELEGKAILAREALAQGLNVVIGSAWPMVSWHDKMPPGIFFFKTMNSGDAQNMLLWAKAGHLIAALDEEMFGIRADSAYIAATVHPRAPALADLVCAQGAAYARAFPFPVPLKITGNPRTKTYKPSRGTDILVCLQSGNINNHGRSFEEMVRKTLGLAQPLTSREGHAWAQILRGSIAHECNVLPLMAATIAAVATAFPDRRVVVRPHPVEDPATWQFEQRNVVLGGGENIVDALASAGTAIFVSGCTTGLDAYLAGVPAVRLGSGGHGISADMYEGVATAADAVEAVRRAATWSGSIADHLAPLDLASHLVELYRANPAQGTVQLNAPGGFEPTAFRQRKFPDMTDAEMEGLLDHKVQRIAWNTFFVAARTPGTS